MVKIAMMQILDVVICKQVKTCHPRVIRRSMNNWTGEELAFRCEHLSVRMSKLAQNFLQMAALSADVSNAEAVLVLIRESKGFLELTALDLDVEQGFELALSPATTIKGGTSIGQKFWQMILVVWKSLVWLKPGQIVFKK
jgi:hypothetical protein